MAVSTDNNIYSACRVECLGKFLVLFNTDMCEQNGQINILSAVCIADFADLRCCILYIYQGADNPFALCVLQHFLGKYAYEHHTHSIDFLDEVRVEQTGADVFDIHVGIDDRE